MPDNNFPTQNKRELRAVVKKAVQNNAFSEWDVELFVAPSILGYLVDFLGISALRREIESWPEKKEKQLKQEFMKRFGETYEDPTVHFFRRYFALIFGNYLLAFFGDRDGEISYRGREEAREFARDEFQSFEEEEIAGVKESESNLEFVGRYLTPSQVLSAGATFSLKAKNRIKAEAKAAQNDAYQVMVLSDLWYLESDGSLPEEVQTFLKDRKWIRMNKSLVEKYKLTGEQKTRFVELMAKAISKKIALDNFSKALNAQLSELNTETTSQLVLDIARKKFWPLRDWLQGTEKLIKDLGGELPQDGPKGWEDSQETDFSSKQEEAKQTKEAQKNEAGAEAKEVASNSQEERQKVQPPKNLPGQQIQESPSTGEEQSDFASNSESEKKAKEEKKKQARLEKMPIKELMKEFPQVKDQPLTSDPIEVEDIEGEVRPTVKNWLKDYRLRMGAGYHDNMQRRSYLFRTENGEKLDKTERKIISELLSSADEREPLPFDPETKKIVISELVSKGEDISEKKEEEKKQAEPTREDKPESPNKESSPSGKDERGLPSGFKKVKESGTSKEKEGKRDISNSSPGNAGENPDPNGKTLDLSK